MHAALQLNDIIYVIFHHVNEPSLEYYEPGGNVGHAALAALARTCQAFHEPALDVLWGDLYFPHPLVYCLPYSPSNDSWCLEYRTNPLTNRDWEVLQKYVPRVFDIPSRGTSVSQRLEGSSTITCRSAAPPKLAAT